MAIKESFILYGSKVWADALKVDYRMRILSIRVAYTLSAVSLKLF